MHKSRVLGHTTFVSFKLLSGPSFHTGVVKYLRPLCLLEDQMLPDFTLPKLQTFSVGFLHSLLQTALSYLPFNTDIELKPRLLLAKRQNSTVMLSFLCRIAECNSPVWMYSYHSMASTPRRLDALTPRASAQIQRFPVGHIVIPKNTFAPLSLS